MQYFDDYGWFTATPIEGREAPEAPPVTSETTTPGESRANWTGTAWLVLPYIAPPPPAAPDTTATAIALQQSIVAAAQKRLDDFARTRNYDGILSAATYATSTNAKFAAEGQYCVLARDQTWAALYAILVQVELGNRPVPTGFADIEDELPVLAWPA